jgi:hypothetical protein
MRKRTWKGRGEPSAYGKDELSEISFLQEQLARAIACAAASEIITIDM